MGPFTHVISIRHSYPDGVPEDRAHYFELCKESLRNQSEQNFRLHIIEERLDKAIEKMKENITTPWIIHTRLDNDDLLHPDFVKKVQARFRNMPMVIDTKGYRKKEETGEVVKFTFYNNKTTSPFLSLIQRTEDLGTGAYQYKHGEMGHRFPLEVIPEFLWLQRIHSSNKQMKWFDGYEKAEREEWMK